MRLITKNNKNRANTSLSGPEKQDHLILETPWYAPRESNQYVEYRR